MNRIALRLTTALILLSALSFICSSLLSPSEAAAQAEPVPATSPAQAVASPGEVSRISQEISNEILSPFCPGKSLDMCPSPNAAAVRREIQDLATQGKSKAEIKEYVITTYGEEFRIIEPPAQDNIALFIALFLGLIFAGALIFALSRRRQDPSDASSPTQPQVLDEDLSDEDKAYLSRLREDLDA